MRNRPLAIAFIALQIVLYAAAWRTVLPKESDFPAFYSAARIWEEGRNPYDLEAQCSKQVPIRGEPCLPFAHPPVLLPLIALISTDDFVASYYRWTIVLLIVALICVLPFYRIAGDWKMAVQSILFLPLVISIALGQDTVFILLGVLLWLWLLLEGRDFWAGLALSLAVVKPQIAVLLGIPLLFARPKAFAGFFAGGLALTLYSFALVGAEGFRGLLNIVRVMSQGQGFGVNPQHMISVTGLLVRAGLSASWSWIFLVLALITISVLWLKFGITRQTVSVAIVLALFCAPHLHLHDLSLLSAPILFLHPLAPVAASAFVAAAYAFGLHQFAAFILFASVLIRVPYLRRNT
ncbi:MAG TPA: glycosyltransferase family 87 protein [Pyrinomonadaceae bacterium]|nr:glycosyltransferase family 87 protein [Pyrinomonadaceae bacterium]